MNCVTDLAQIQTYLKEKVLISVFNHNVYEPKEFDKQNPVVKKVGITKQTLDIGRPIK